MPRRRACLVVPATKVEKGRTLEADEIVIDLEDAVLPSAKDDARPAVVDALGLEWEAPALAVRVNAINSPWCHQDLCALAVSDRPLTAVLPKVETVADLAFADRLLTGAEAACGREDPIRLLALIETAAGLQAAWEIAAGSQRLDGLILGYADLAASLARPPGGDWRHAQETVLVAARAAGVQAFDGKWAIHPAQLDALREAFTPSDEEVADARRTLEARERAAAAGAGAVADGDRMLDEALAVSARRVIAQAGS